MSWTYDTTTNSEFGIFIVKVWRGGMAPLDVTFFRDVPLEIQDMTWADPFGPATARLRFPTVTGWDNETTVPWMREFTNVDIYYLPCTATQWFPGESTVVNPLTERDDLYLHQRKQNGDPILPIWEGFMVNFDPDIEGTVVQCQGALYQLDYYYAKPLNPSRPRSVEGAIKRYLNPSYRGIYTQELVVEFPAGWTKQYTQADFNEATALGYERYAPTDLGVQAEDWYAGSTTVTPEDWTGFLTRYTGSWDKVLTGYVQGQLSYLYAPPENGSTLAKGDQWTITLDPGRQPRMYVRRSLVDPTVVAWYNQPGVEARLTRDGSQVVNIMFAEGRGANNGGDVAFNMWRQPNPKAAWCVWQPIAAIPASETPVHQSLRTDHNYPNGYGIYHFFDSASGAPQDPLYTGMVWNVKNPAGTDPVIFPQINDLPDAYDAEYERQNGVWVSEKKVDFPDGVDEAAARVVAENWIAQDKDPGWSGTITLKADLRDPLGNIVSKWSLRDGDSIALLGFRGEMTPVQGVNKFHISQVTANPTENAVTLTVDTKYRDLLSVEEAIARGRDTLSPVKSLQINRKSAMLNDLIVGWNFRQGSGYFPRMAHTYDIDDAFPHSNAKLTKKVNNSGNAAAGYFQKAGHRPIDIFQSAFRNGGQGIHIPGWDPDQVGIGGDKLGGDDQHLQNPGIGAPRFNGNVLQSGKEALFVPVWAGAARAEQRWASYPILLSQAGTIMRTEFCVYDQYGNIAPVEYHVNIYPRPDITVDGMPWNGSKSALSTGAFQRYNPNTGYEYTQSGDQLTFPSTEPIVGWGNEDQPAGYSPKRYLPNEVNGGGQTGLLTDGAPWTYNFFGNENFPVTDPGYTQADRKAIGYTNVSVGCMVYIEYQTDPAYEWLYVYGRVYRGIEAT